ncbi:hypothetical protein PM082_001742 [Marasmius tenuissimus]|nr:hypothetical protein PM082_001742 [Marasmius tenuissimus]
MNGVSRQYSPGNQPRITYHAASRTFDRLFREASLDEMKTVVRRKLGLPQNAVVLLSQDRGGQMIDLEDDDDFDAFRAVAHSVACVNVKVAVQQTAESSSPSHAPTTNGIVDSESPDINTPIPTHIEEDSSTNQRKRKVTFENDGPARSPSTDAEQVLPPSKRRRANTTTGPKHHEATDHSDSTTDGGGTITPTASKATVATNDKDVSMEPSASPEHTPPPPTIIAAAPTINANDLGTTSQPQENATPTLAPSHTASDAPALPESKKRKKRKGQDSESTVDQGTEATRTEPVEKTEKKKRKKKAKPQGGAIESEKERSSNEATENNAGSTERFPQELANAISRNADIDETAEETEKKRKRRKSEIKNKSIKDTVPEEKEAANDSIASKKKPAAPKGKTTADKSKATGDGPSDPSKIEKKRRQSISEPQGHSISDIVRETIRRKQRERKEQQAANALQPESEPAPAPAPTPTPAQPSFSAKTASAKPRPPKKVSPPPMKVAQKDSDEFDSDDSIKALQRAARKPYMKEKGRTSSVDVDLEEVIRGPSSRRLTLDNMLRKDFAGKKSGKDVVLEEEQEEVRGRRKSAAARADPSDSDLDIGEGGGEDDDDSMKEDEVPSKSVSEPPVVHDTSVANETPDTVPPLISGSPSKESTPAEDGAVSQSATEPEDDPENATHAHEPEAPPAEVSVKGLPDDSGVSHDSPSLEGHLDTDLDPIESAAGSPPRATSPIELPHNSPVKSRMKRRGGTASLPVIPAPLTSLKGAKTANALPVSVHEAVIREKVVKMTRSRSKLMNDTPARSSSTALEPSQLEDETPTAKPTSRSQTSAGPLSPSDGWATLNVSSPTEPESSFLNVDQLRSSLEPDGDIPLFIPSETQPGFPYSQYRDLVSQNKADSLDDSQDEDEVVASVTSQKKRPSAARFRSLTQIASQPRLYTPPLLPSTAPQTRSSTKKDLYGDVANAYGDDSDSDSDSEEEKEKSHIPRSRRAGKKGV